MTFGSFNNNGKINAHVLDLWAEVLYCLPDQPAPAQVRGRR